MTTNEAIKIIRTLHKETTERARDYREYINANPTVFVPTATQWERKAQALALALDALGMWQQASETERRASKA